MEIVEKGLSLVAIEEGHRHTPSQSKRPQTTLKSTIPDEIVNNRALNQSISSLLPDHYSFEIHKSIHQIRTFNVKCVALQLPEGLQMFATAVAFILEKFSYQQEDMRLDVVILADVTYGACCIDDLSARALGCDMIIHYGHSCLVPITTTVIRTLYVFVDIKFDLKHFYESLLFNLDQGHLLQSFTESGNARKQARIAMLSTIQFAASLHVLLQIIQNDGGYVNAFIPQEKPLSPGEILGCTSPRLPRDTDLVLYVGDGRFHLESIMIANYQLGGKFYRYDPYTAKLTREWYEMDQMLAMRREAIEIARAAPVDGKWAVVLGTLGRQGSLNVVQWISQKLKERYPRRQLVTILISELSPEKMRLFANDIDIWVQTSCPRLSIDWGSAYVKPLLTPYEAMLALMSDEEWSQQKPKWFDRKESADHCCSNHNSECCNTPADPWNEYPMDFYSKSSLGPWTPNHVSKQEHAEQERKRLERKLALQNKLNRMKQTNSNS